MKFSGLPSLCLKDLVNYGNDFNITYQTFDKYEEKMPLKIGENYLSLAKEKVSLTKIYTRWNSICYKINTTRKPDFKKTEIKLKTSGFKTFDTTKTIIGAF